MRVLLTGASGHVGGRLLTRLRHSGVAVRCVARDPARLEGAGVEVVRGDVLDPASLPPALADCDAAYYLVHSLATGAGWEESERAGAAAFAAAAAAAGVRRLVYLGGLGGRGRRLSDHLESRHEVGRILAASGIPTIEFRASILIGSGSASFELIRRAVENIPVLVLPDWAENASQPIAADDAVEYLAAALRLPADTSAVFEIGGADRVSYAGLVREVARQRGLRRLVTTVPALAPPALARALGLAAPAEAQVALKLLESLRNETVVEDDAALRAFPLRPRGYREAVAAALAA